MSLEQYFANNKINIHDLSPEIEKQDNLFDPLKIITEKNWDNILYYANLRSPNDESFIKELSNVFASIKILDERKSKKLSEEELKIMGTLFQEANIVTSNFGDRSRRYLDDNDLARLKVAFPEFKFSISDELKQDMFSNYDKTFLTATKYSLGLKDTLHLASNLKIIFNCTDDQLNLDRIKDNVKDLIKKWSGRKIDEFSWQETISFVYNAKILFPDLEIDAGLLSKIAQRKKKFIDNLKTAEREEKSIYPFSSILLFDYLAKIKVIDSEKIEVDEERGLVITPHNNLNREIDQLPVKRKF